MLAFVAWASVLWALLGVVLLGAAQVFGLTLPERWVQRGAVWHSMGVVAAGLFFAHALLTGAAPVLLSSPTFFELHGAHWQVDLLIDPLAEAWMVLLAMVYPPIVRFSVPSFHREPGSQRFWFLVTLFQFGLVMVFLAGNIDVFFLGWEVVGVTSVSLIAFFRRNLRSTFNSARALISYRLCDLGVLGAAVWMHHAFPSSDFTHLREDASLPTSAVVAFALLFGSLAKSAQLPMSSWLHRAMEGPASSSAIFYGALSVHLGPVLLLRTAPLWMPHPEVRVVMGLIGAATALYASMVGRARPDAKTALAYAVMAMLGVIFIELALGWHTVALVHLVAHAGLRTWQFLRSSSLIQDFQENPMVRDGVKLGRRSRWELIIPPSWRRGLYLAAMRQFWLDETLQHLVARPVIAVFTALERWEAQWLGPAPEEP